MLSSGLGFEKTQRLVGRDAIDPSEQLTIAFKMGNISIDLYKSVLKHIIGVIVRNHNFSNVPIKPLFIE